MTPISRSLYNNLPYYLRMLDEQGSGMLKHITDPTQTQLDKWSDAKGMIELIENPDTIPKSWAYWAQQKVGGAGTREHWLGIGVHPDWPVERMRRFLLESWNYWNTKGTQSSIRWAIDFWLDWEKSHNPIYLEFRRPFGDRPTSEPTQWWSYATPYGANVTQHYTEFQFWGGGDYPQQYQPEARTLRQDTWQWDFETVWDDRLLVLDRPPEIDNSRSGLGPRNVWMHFHLNETEWNKVAPDIHKLNPETWHSLARPQVFLWQDIEAKLKLVEDPEFPIATTKILYSIDGFQFGDIFPWPVNQPPRVDLQIVQRAWQSDPYFQFNDCWGGSGGEPVSHSDRYNSVEVQRFSPYWTAYTFLAEVVKQVFVPSVPNEIGWADIGTDFQSVYAFPPNLVSTTETRIDLVFSPGTIWFSTYLDCFGGGDEIIRGSLESQTVSTPAVIGSSFEDLFFASGISTTSIYSTEIQSNVGADYLTTYDEVWQYNVEIILEQQVSASFLVPAETWSIPYSQRTILQEFPNTYTPTLPANKWFAPEAYVEIETVVATPGSESGQPDEYVEIETVVTTPGSESGQPGEFVSRTVSTLAVIGSSFEDLFFVSGISTTSIYSTEIQWNIGADYLTTYDEIWQYNVEIILEQQVSASFLIPAEPWSIPYSQRTTTVFTPWSESGQPGGIESQTISTLAVIGSSFVDLFFASGTSTASTYSTEIQWNIGADYLTTYDEIWQYNVEIILEQQVSASFLIPAEMWSIPYSQRTILQEFPNTDTATPPTNQSANQWFSPERYVEIETVVVTLGSALGQPGELWQATNFRSLTGEDIEIAEIVEIVETVETLGFNGAQYTDTYSWANPGVSTQTVSTTFRYLPGATFQDCFNEVWSARIEVISTTDIETSEQSGSGVPWTIAQGAWVETIEELVPGIPEFTEPATTHLWYANYREWEEAIEIEIPGSQNCWAGLLADVSEGQQTIPISAEPEFAPNLWGSITLDTQTTTVAPGFLGSVGIDFQTPYFGFGLPQTISFDLAPISLDGIAPLKIEASPIAPVILNTEIAYELFTDANQIFNSDDWWQHPGKASVETVFASVGGFRIDAPQLCFQYLDTYNSSFQWYAYGVSTEATSVVEPVIQQYSLCNVVDNFTLSKIENRREVIESITDSERAIEKTYPLLQQAARQQNWTLSVETDEELMLVEPLVFFTEKNGARSLEISLDRQFNLEFVFIVGRFTHIRSISLFVGHEIVESKTYTIPLNVHPKDKIGFKFTVNLAPQPLIVLP